MPERGGEVVQRQRVYVNVVCDSEIGDLPQLFSIRFDPVDNSFAIWVSPACINTDSAMCFHVYAIMRAKDPSYLSWQ